MTLRRPREGTALLLGAMRMANEEGYLGAELRARFNLTGYIGTDDPRRCHHARHGGNSQGPTVRTRPERRQHGGQRRKLCASAGDFEMVLELERASTSSMRRCRSGVRGYAADGQVAAWATERRTRAPGSGRAATRRHHVGPGLSRIRFHASSVELRRREDSKKPLCALRASRDAYCGYGRMRRSPLCSPGASSLLLADARWGLADQSALDEFMRSSVPGSSAVCGRSDAASSPRPAVHDESASRFRQVIDEWRYGQSCRSIAHWHCSERAVLLGDRDADAAAGQGRSGT